MNKTLFAIIVPLIGFSDSLQAQQTAAGNQTLDTRQQKIVAIAALTAKGDLEKLKPIINTALDSGLTVNEIKEVMVHLSAYCGFPRSLNGINTFLAVSNERKAKGIADPIGTEPFPISRAGNKYEVGKKNLENLTGRPESGPKTGYAAFVPVIDTLLKEHLFADIFNRGVLTWQDRELTTVSALVSLGGVEAQLQGHLSISLGVGLTEAQLGQMLAIVENYIGKKEAEAGKAVLNRVLGARRRPN
jgi:alkylhydroperoxidase/carboxymuconolactone decarboxylase family protein YurZ